MKKLIVMLVILAMLLSLSACIPKIKTEDGEISFKDGNATFQTSEDGTSLPKGFPTNVVPIIRESNVIVSSKQTVDGRTEYWVTVQCRKDVEEVMEFYKDVMKSAEEKQVVESNDMSMIIGVKDEMQISLTMFPEEDEYKSTLSISIIVAE